MLDARFLALLSCWSWLEAAQGQSSSDSGWENGGWRTVYVRPNWELFTSFDDSRGFIGGNFRVEYNWNSTLPLDDPRELVAIDNFASGSSGYVKGTIVNFGSTDRLGTTTYVGEFKEHLEGSCYPFDVQTMDFTMHFRPPGDTIMQFALVCDRGSTAYDADGNEVVVVHEDFRANGVITKCVAPDDPNAIYVGFLWRDFECQLVTPAQVRCTMVGIRRYAKLLKSQAFPAVAFTAMGFASFRFPHKFAMPRVATVMLALLSIVNKLNQVLHQVPSSGGIPWIEEVYIIAQSMMLLNLMTHVYALRQFDQGLQNLAKTVDILMFGVGLALFMLFNTIMLHARECTAYDQMPKEISALLVALSAAWLIIGTMYIVWTHREAVRELINSKKDVDGKDPESSIHLDNP